MSMTQEAGRVYALLADGTTVEIRPARPDDFDAVKAMHEAMSPDNAYLRFFNASRLAAEQEARRTCQQPGPDHGALLALSAGEVVGCVSFSVTGESGEPGDAPETAAPQTQAQPGGRTAEIAFAVADHMHHRGIATLLLEHLVSFASSRQISTFNAQTLSENKTMQNVFAGAGLPMQRRFADGIFDMTFPLPADDAGAVLDTYLDAVAGREGSADAASLRPIFMPESVVVVGASRRRETAGRAILDNIRTGAYAGRLYAVNPHAPLISGERCLSSVLDLPEPVDLAVIAVPAAAVLDAAEQCGQRGVRSLVVITAGLDTGARADLLAVCRRHGMRLVGPDCYGVAVPSIGLDATFAARHPRPGVAGLVSQSGGLGLALADQLSRIGIGISSFASTGDKLDVSSNDMLMWWEHDGITKLAVLYIESFGNPRKFARTARRVGAAMPVLTVQAGLSGASQQTAGSHIVAESLVSPEALFEQAGIITTRGLGELIEATALLATQPVPAGRTVAIVSNVAGAGRLAAQACTGLGLTVHRPRGLTRSRLHALVPHRGAVDGPVDTTATVSGADFRQCLELLAADEEVHSMIAIVLPTSAAGDLVAAIQEAASQEIVRRVPLAAVVLNQPEAVRLLARSSGNGDKGQLPAYCYPEAAAAAVAHAAGYGAWRARPHGQVPSFPDVRAADARTLVRGFLRGAPDGGSLPAGQTAELLRCYGIALNAAADAAANAAARAGGTEVTVRVGHDHMFGSLVVFGVGGVVTEMPGDRAARLTPLTDTDADTLIRSIRSAPLLLGHLGRPAADLGALRDLLLRVSRLAGDLPEVTDLDLSPVVARPDGILVLGAQLKVAPFEPRDAFLRKLR
jgi:acyl-CoA synthetase (NDP forming)/RimJ/RimL family protein N-acetyltransferase